MLFEKPELGSLHSALRSEPGIPDELRLHTATGIALGVEYLHNRACVHGSLSSLTVFLEPGFAARLLITRLSEEREPAGPDTHNLQWLPAEALQMDRWLSSVDVFSFSVVLWELWEPRASAGLRGPRGGIYPQFTSGAVARESALKAGGWPALPVSPLVWSTPYGRELNLTHVCPKRIFKFFKLII